MKSIKELCSEVKDENEIFFRIKNKKIYDKILDEMKPIDSFEWFDWFKNYSYKNTYFIYAQWRCGDFMIRNKDTDIEVSIASDSKNGDEYRDEQRAKIDNCIKILDKYREYVSIAKVMFDDDFNIVKEV